MKFSPQNMPEFSSDKQRKKADDSRNMMMFVLAVLALLFLFDSYIMQPKLQRLQQAEDARRLLEGGADPNLLLSQAQLPGEDPSAAISSGKPITTQGAQGAGVSAVAPAQNIRIPIVNKELTGSLNLTGARLDDLRLNNYYETLKKETPITLLAPSHSKRPYYNEFGWVAQSPDLNLPKATTNWSLYAPGGDAKDARLTPDHPVTLRWDNGQGLIFERIISIDEDFLFTVEQRILNRSDRTIRLHPYALISRRGTPQDLQNIWILHEGPIAYLDKKLHQASYDDLLEARAPQSYTGRNGWAGITDKYWMVTLIPDQESQKTFRFVQSRVGGEGSRSLPLLSSNRFQTDILGDVHVIGPGESTTHQTHLFAGAKKVNLIEAYEDKLNIPHFDLSVDFGWFYFITKPFFHAISFFFELTGNFGVAIILFTIALRLLVFPLANTSYKSFAKMKQISPQIMELRESCKDDKRRLQQELVKLYQKEKVNPLAGCFPILVQIPIFFSLYKVLFIALEMRHAPFFGWIQDLSVADPTSLFNLFGLLPYEVPGILLIGVWPCLMLVTLLVQQRLNPPPPDPMQRQIMMMFPFIMTYIMAQFAAGLVIYWTVSAMLAIVQQYVIMRRMGVEVHLFKRSAAEEKIDDMVAHGQGAMPEAEMIAEDVQHALIGDEEDGDEAKPKISPPKHKSRAKTSRKAKKSKKKK